MGELSAEVSNNPSAGRFEVRIDGQVAFLVYRRSGGTLALVHTEVPEPLRGRGIADRLAHAALEYAREQGLAVRPICPFVKAYIGKHPEYQAMVLTPA